LTGAAEKMQEQGDQEVRKHAEFNRIMNEVCFDRNGEAIEYV
jgi:hypothetical protein